MGILFDIRDAMLIDRVDDLLMDIARLAQVPPSKHVEAIEHYVGLASHVDRAGSPLENKVLEIYPSGSFSIHCATYSRIRLPQHDVDAVVEMDAPQGTDPAWMLDQLYKAIKGERGSKYYDFKIERNTRCVTVIYPDGVTVDLMPVVRIPYGPERSANLFHHKPDTGERYRKEVNPKAFTNHFNANIASSAAFATKYWRRRMLVENLVEKAETQPMPDQLPIEQKSPRLIAIQLLKRFRDVQYRDKTRKDRGLRRPPSVVIAALALEAGPMSDSLTSELRAIAGYFLARIKAAESLGETLVVCNPAHTADVFTDRWPESRETQRLWQSDLERLCRALTALENGRFDPDEAHRLLKDLFGETLAEYAIEKHFAGQSEIAKVNGLGIAGSGAVRPALAAPAIVSGLVVPARASTNMEGVLDDLDD